MPWKYNNVTIRVGKSWIDNNSIRHPKTWSRWSDDDKAAAGLVWEDAPASETPFDSRFYWGRQADGDLIERSLDDVNEVDEDGNPLMQDGQQVVTLGLKSQYKAQTKTTAASLLAPTDWHVVKAAEVAGYTVPSAITQFRSDVRAASNTIEAAIDAASDLTAFMALWDVPIVDGEPSGNAPINDWPDEI
jgi:hypothetical protein